MPCAGGRDGVRCSGRLRRAGGEEGEVLQPGQGLFDKGDLVKARLEVKNALQIDPKYAEGYELLGQIELKDGQLPGGLRRLRQGRRAQARAVRRPARAGQALADVRRAGPGPREGGRGARPGAAERGGPAAEGLGAGREEGAGGRRRVFEGLLAQGVQKPEVYLVLATAYGQGPKPSKAEKALQDGIAANPGSAALHLVLAKFYSDAMRRTRPSRAEQGDRARAGQAGAQVQPGQPSTGSAAARPRPSTWSPMRSAADAGGEETRETAARFYISKRQPFEAAKVLEEGVAKKPQSFRLRILLGEVYLNQNQPQKAVGGSGAVPHAEQGPGRPRGHPGQDHARPGAPAAAADRQGRGLRQRGAAGEPQEHRGPPHQGRDVPGQGRRRRAPWPSSGRWSASGPSSSPATCAWRAPTCSTASRTSRSSTLQNALKVDPRSKEALQTLARVYACRRTRPRPRSSCAGWWSSTPTTWPPGPSWATSWPRSRRSPEAEEAYRASRPAPAANPLGYLKLSRLYRQQGKEKEALRELEDGYRQNQTSAALLTELIQVYMQQKKHSAAVAVCRKRIDDNPRDVFAYNLLGLVFTDMKNYPEAEVALKKAIEMQPLWPAPHTNLAKLYLVQGRKKEAVEKFNGGHRRQPARRLRLPVARAAATSGTRTTATPSRSTSAR